MKILFVHQNFPGQFIHLAPELQRLGHECVALTDLINKRESTIRTWRYKYESKPVPAETGRLGRRFIESTDRAAVVARAARILKEDHGFSPDLIIGHSGWGETLFLNLIWPEAKQLIYSEFYYQGIGADTGFDLEFQSGGLNLAFAAQARAAHMAQALAHADLGLAPTKWQAASHPAALRDRIRVIFDGVDTDLVRPDPAAKFTLPDGRILSAGDEVLTFVNRNLEPYRGYHIFMRALPEVLRARPNAQVLIVGGDGVSYGRPPDSGTWKERILAEVRDRLDLGRVHFLGKIPYPDFRKLLQVTRVHAYLTYPFVLSWSMVEAMAAGALVIGSRTAPVEEMIRQDETGLLVDFFDIPGWSQQITEALAEPERFLPLRQAARRHVIENYDLTRVCLPQQLALVKELMGGGAG